MNDLQHIILLELRIRGIQIANLSALHDDTPALSHALAKLIEADYARIDNELGYVFITRTGLRYLESLGG